jgi:hypothetical protein
MPSKQSSNLSNRLNSPPLVPTPFPGERRARRTSYSSIISSSSNSVRAGRSFYTFSSMDPERAVSNGLGNVGSFTADREYIRDGAFLLATSLNVALAMSLAQHLLNLSRQCVRRFGSISVSIDVKRFSSTCPATHLT